MLSVNQSLPVVDARDEYGVDGEGDAGDVEGEEALEDGVRVAADGVVGRAQEGAHLQCTHRMVYMRHWNIITWLVEGSWQ